MDFASYFYTKRTRAIAHAIETQVLTKPGYDLATLGPAKAREIIKMGSFDTIANVIKTMREIANVSSSSTHSVETEQALEELDVDTDLRNEFNALLDKMHNNIKQKSINKIANLNKTIEELNEEVDIVTSEAEEAKKKLIEEIYELKVKNEELIAKAAQLETKLTTATEVNNTLTKEIQTLKKEKDEQGQDLLNAIQKNDKLVKEIDDAIAAKKEAEQETKTQLADANKTINDLTAKEATAKAQLADAKQRIEELIKEKADAVKQATELAEVKARADAQAEITKLQEQLKTAQEQLKKATEAAEDNNDGSDTSAQKITKSRKK